MSHPRPVNLAFGTRVTLLEVIELLESKLGTSVQVEHVDPRAGDVKHSQASNKTRRSLFPDVVPVPLDEGLDATITWMRTALA